ncbi:MAG: TrmB family transcriptional regulator [Desulfobacula sp.]|uniref:TrmB family transcriptional regulator n=1 Tax=Desulfobacula sp. TaxID=2593537 RepID=UPI0025C0D4A9|nr:helix-turn-helix domain-containing protein [Desulfobacula sp.]MCD4722531.1 TrmB family transcriptional regulator [Desulfobacula sp.]
MDTYSNLKELGFSQYEAACYMALVGSHPVNGSQLSKISGIARSRIYDVLRSLISKGYVIEVNSGQYAPLPSDELVRRLKRSFNSNIETFEDQISNASQKDDFEFVWTITGYENVMEKALEMIKQAKEEIYIRLFPKANRYLDEYLIEADKRGVKIRYIAMGKVPKKFDIQVMHPDHEHLQQIIGGRSLEVIIDKKEALVGIFETGNEDNSPINWTRNQWFIVANRDSLRHDFYHCFLEKILDRHQKLTKDEKRIYKIIKEDN